MYLICFIILSIFRGFGCAVFLIGCRVKCLCDLQKGCILDTLNVLGLPTPIARSRLDQFDANQIGSC